MLGLILGYVVRRLVIIITTTKSVNFVAWKFYGKVPRPFFYHYKEKQKSSLAMQDYLTACLPAIRSGSTMVRATIFKLGARGRRPCVPGFLKLLWFAHRYVCLSVCMH